MRRPPYCTCSTSAPPGRRRQKSAGRWACLRVIWRHSSARSSSDRCSIDRIARRIPGHERWRRSIGGIPKPGSFTPQQRTCGSGPPAKPCVRRGRTRSGSGCRQQSNAIAARRASRCPGRQPAVSLIYCERDEPGGDFRQPGASRLPNSGRCWACQLACSSGWNRSPGRCRSRRRRQEGRVTRLSVTSSPGTCEALPLASITTRPIVTRSSASAVRFRPSVCVVTTQAAVTLPRHQLIY